MLAISDSVKKFTFFGDVCSGQVAVGNRDQIFAINHSQSTLLMAREAVDKMAACIELHSGNCFQKQERHFLMCHPLVFIFLW